MGGALYGPCNGGPYDMERLTHHCEVLRVAIHMPSRKPIPAMVASADPDIKFGEYRFADGIWNWRPPDSE